jgi:putative NADH-flavin reductase
MRIIVIGASGRVGSSVVEQALAAGHEVTAFLRDPRRLKPGAEKAHVAVGDATSVASVTGALRADRYDAVIGALGGNTTKPSTLVTDGARAIIAAMKATNVKRYVGVSGTANMPMTGLGRATIGFFNLTPIRHAIRDHDGAFAQWQASGLSWTLFGCLYIPDGPARGTFNTSSTFPGGLKQIHPPDMASAIVRERADNKHPKAIVGVWY